MVITIEAFFCVMVIAVEVFFLFFWSPFTFGWEILFFMLFLSTYLEGYQAFLGNGCKTLGMRIICCELGSLVLEAIRVYHQKEVLLLGVDWPFPLILFAAT